MGRVNKQALFADLGYEPHAGQWEVHASVARRRVVVCGVRWGKTTCAAMEGLAAALEPAARSIGWVVAPTYDLSDRVFLEILRTAQQHLRHRILRANERERQLTLINLGGGTSEIRGKSADRPASLLGEGLDWVIVDEAARLSAEVWQGHLVQRLIDRRGWAMLISTPRGADWLYELHQSGLRGIDPDVDAWNFPSWDNPYLDSELIESERVRLPEEVFDREFGAVFQGTDRSACVHCGWPSDSTFGFHVLYGTSELQHCTRCERVVDEHGHTVMGRSQDGRPYLKVLRLPWEEGDETERSLPRHRAAV